MFNPYSIILGLFVLLGLTASWWGWSIISKSRKSLTWPKVEGKIVECSSKSELDDLLPHIVYAYSVEGNNFKGQLTFARDVTPTKEFTNRYLQQYPLNKTVAVYFDRLQPQHSTLEPGLAQGDWLVFAIGVASTIIGILLFLTH